MESGQKADVSPSEGEIEMVMTKSCSDCKATKTPLWRSGPTGPKSLCNACGIRYRKKRPSASSSSYKNDMSKVKLDKPRIVKLRDDMKVNLNKACRVSPVKRLRSPRQWGEVERAALLLMALSCGALFA